MSRLQKLTIPFVQGQNDAIAAEVLPDGALVTLTNGRFNKAGELALRTGWRPLPMTETLGTTVVARDLYSYEESLVALRDSSGVLTLCPYSVPGTSISRPWYATANKLSPVTDFRAIGGIPPTALEITRVSLALTADGVYGVTFAQNPSLFEDRVRVYRTATDETLTYRQLANPGRIRQVVSLGATFGMVENTGSALTLLTCDPTGTSLFGSTVTLVTAVVTEFHAATALVASPGGLYVTWVEGGDVFAAKFTLAGVQVGSTKTIDAGTNEACRIASDDSTVHVAYQADPSDVVSVLSFSATSPYTTTAGPTAMFSSAAVQDDGFDIAAVGTGCAVVGQTGSPVGGVATISFTTLTAAHAATNGVTRRESLLYSGLVVHGSKAAYGYSRDSAFIYADSSQPWFVLHGVASDRTDGIGLTDPPYVTAQSASGKYAVAGRAPDGQPIVRVFTIDPTARRQGCVANGELYVSGGALATWAGIEPVEAGILAPVFEAVVGSNGSGSLTPLGVYKYRAILHWTNSRGSDFQGEVSVEFETTMGAADDTNTVTLSAPPSLTRSLDLLAGPELQLYRTEAGPGELFYLTATGTVSSTADLVGITDTTSDASLLDEARIYTEGDTGATSGRLSNVLARPCSYVAPTRDRLVLGGPDPEYQISQLALAAEPVLFADPGVDGPIALSYFDQADADVTAVATLDDTVIVGTARSLFVTGGDGPNFSGVGEFTSPARLPSNVGFYDWRSLLETNEGLWFLGDSDKLFLLERGQSAPVWAGEAVQDRLSGGVVGAARDSVAHVAGWAVAGASPSVVIRDLTLGAWSGDTLPFTPASLVGHAGHFWAVQTTTGVVWEQSLTAYGDGAAGATAVALQGVTGDVQVFGLAGHGRLAAVEFEGIFRAAAALLCEVSYDQGLTWTGLGTHTVTGLTAGEVFQRQFYPARQRGGKFRVRFTMTPSVTTTEGCRLTGFSVFYTTRSGPSRLSSGKRL